MDDNGQKYTKHDVRVLTELAELKKDVYNIIAKVNDIHAGFQAQWKKIDEHSKEIASLNTKAGLFGSVGGIMVSIIIAFFTKFFGKT